MKKGAPVGCHAIIGWNNAGKKIKITKMEIKGKKIKWMNEGKERKKKKINDNFSETNKKV